MNRKEYFKLTLEQQVNYINEKMKKGKSFNATCKDILLAKGGVSAKFKKHGYKLIENQYILKQVPEKQNLKEYEKEPQLDGVTINLQEDNKVIENASTVQENETDVNQSNEVKSVSDNIEPLEEISKKINSIVNKEKKTQLKAKVGRPQKYKKDHVGKNIDKKKFTLEIDKQVYKALKSKKREEEFTINYFVEELLRKTIEDKYFKDVIE